MITFDITIASKGNQNDRYTIRTKGFDSRMCLTNVLMRLKDPKDEIIGIKEVDETDIVLKIKDQGCPFSWCNGKIQPCQREKCMAFRHIIDGYGKDNGEYCKLIDKKGV